MAHKIRLAFRGVLVAAFLAGIHGCDDDDDGIDTVTIVLTGTSASDFTTLASYVNHPVVQAMFRVIPRYEGAVPPNLSGTYLSSGVVTHANFGLAAGNTVNDEFCFGMPSGAAIEVAVLSLAAVEGGGSFIEDAGAYSFIEGSGDFFTIYTAFKSVQTGPEGGTCEIHLVVVFSGKQEFDNSISSLFIGSGIVGLVGDCGSLLVDDIQISENTAIRTGDSCVGGATPADPNQVLVFVDNFLVTDVDISVNGVFFETAPLLGTIIFEASPGFTLSFESVTPLNESGKAMGEVLAGNFAPDTQPKGRFSQYSITNQIGEDVFFAPTISNQTTGVLTAMVNVGTAFEFDCECALPASALSQYVLGYHALDVVEVGRSITPDLANVVVDNEFPAVNPPEFTIFGFDTQSFILEENGSFRFLYLGLDSGVLSLIFE